MNTQTDTESIKQKVGEEEGEIEVEIRDDYELSMCGQYLYAGKQGSGARIVFCRTLRIPEDDKIYPLPPSLGYFKMKNIDEYRETVPKEWLKDGGVFFPMFQREAMWIGLHSSNLNDRKKRILKIGIGNVNIVSGQKFTPTLQPDEEKQDYVVIGDQPWVDGICAGNGYIKQFIAMPLGEGYTVEEQVLGEERGGLQFLCYEAKEAEKSRYYDTMSNIYATVDPNFKPYEGPMPEGEYKICIRTLTGKKLGFIVESDTKIRDLKFTVQNREGIPIDQQRLIFAGRELEERTLKDYGIKEDAVMHLVLRLRGGGDGQKSREMGLSAGGKMKQKIYTDKHGIGYWNQSRASKVVVRVVNSKMYEKITGEKAPNSYISARTYTEHGLPWFDIYDENVPSVKKSEVFVEKVKSVKEVDKKKKQNDSWPKIDNETVKIDGKQVITYQKKDLEE